VDLAPGGRTLDPASLSVRTSAGTSNVGGDGRVSTMIFEEGPQYAELLDRRGRTVMLAFASTSEPDFSALSTSKALAYLALAGPWMKEDGRLKLLDEADTVAGFLPLLAAVQSQLSTSGYLDLEAEGIQSAIESIVTTAYGTSSGLNAIVRPHGVLATPTTASGLSLDTRVDGKLTIQNVYLRRVSLFFRRYSHVPAEGPEVKENNPFTRIDMPNVARYGGITGTLDSYFKGEVAYSPVQTDPPLEIPRFPADAKETTYQVFAIGPGFSTHPNLNVPADIIGEQQILEIKALFLDAFLVLMANVALPLKGDQVDEFLEFASANAVITDIIGNLKSTLPDVWDKAAAGEYGDALGMLMTSAYTSNTILPALAQLTLDFLWKNTGINEDDYDMLFNGMKGMLEKMGKIDIGFTLADTFLLFRDFGASYKIEQFVVTTTPGKVTLAVARNQLRIDESTTIAATIQDRDPAGVYEFHWSVSPRANYWLDDRRIGTDETPEGVLVTGESTVDIRSLVNSEGTAVVLCKVYRIDGGRREVGEEEASILFVNQLLPNEVPSRLITKGTPSRIIYSGTTPRYESAYVTMMLVFDVMPGKTYALSTNGNYTGATLTAAQILAGAPVFDMDVNYGDAANWPRPYRGNWYNMGNGKAGFSFESHTVVITLPPYVPAGGPTIADAIAAEIARKEALVLPQNPKIFVVP
jgi:hypothetical protein